MLQDIFGMLPPRAARIQHYSSTVPMFNMPLEVLQLTAAASVGIAGSGMLVQRLVLRTAQGLLTVTNRHL